MAPRHPWRPGCSLPRDDGDTGAKARAGSAAACADASTSTSPGADGLTAYEAARAARIAANQARLAALGIPSAAWAMAPAAPDRQPRPAARRPAQARPPPSTRTLRARPPPPPRPPPSASCARRPAVAWAPSDLDTSVPRTVAPPFTTRCGALTIHSFGRVVAVDPDASPAWWSSAGARFRHAYGDGYAATRHRALGGRDFRCEVGACPASGLPVFTVTDVEGGGRAHAGPSPTRPWTAHCIATGTGVRVSGPLFYGFCEALVQAGLAAMVEAAAKGAAAPGGLRPPSLGGGGGGGGGGGAAVSPAVSPSPPPPRRVRRRAAAVA